MMMQLMITHMWLLFCCSVTAAVAERIARRLSGDSIAAANTAKILQAKLERGQQTADRGRFTRLKDGACVLMVYSVLLVCVFLEVYQDMHIKHAHWQVSG
jgi:hypothetical protein